MPLLVFYEMQVECFVSAHPGNVGMCGLLMFCPGICFGGCRKNVGGGELIQNIWCPSLDLNLERLEYKSEVLPLE
jgi:hypothetical protein